MNGNLLPEWLAAEPQLGFDELLWLQSIGVLGTMSTPTNVVEETQPNQAQSSNPDSKKTETALTDSNKQDPVPFILNKKKSDVVDDKEGKAPLTNKSSGAPCRLPGVRALPEAREVQRALRALKRKRDSRSEFVLDVPASVEAMANGANNFPELVYKPKRERWLRLSLVIDQAPAMILWQEAVAELRRLCERLGGFRDVRVWFLDAERVRLRTPRSPQTRSMRELVGAQGQSMTWVLSAFASAAWTKPILRRAVAEIGKTQALALFHMLPAKMWQLSALDPWRPYNFWGAVSAQEKGVANTTYAFDSQHSAWVEAPVNGVAIPVICLDPDSLKSYAALITKPRQARAPAIYFSTVTSQELELATSTPNKAELSDEAIQRHWHAFLENASKDAIRLATLLAHVHLQLPIVRLVQHGLMHSNGTLLSANAVLSEVFLSGLIKRIPPDAKDSRLVVPFDFQNGIRARLEAATDRSDIVRVGHVLSNYLSQRRGHPLDFWALLDAGDDSSKVEGNDVLAYVKATIRPSAILGTTSPSVKFRGLSILWLKTKHAAGDSIWHGATIKSVLSAREAASALDSHNFDALVCEFDQNLDAQRERLELLDKLDQHGPFLPVLMLMDTQAFALEAENFGAVVCAASGSEFDAALVEALSKPRQRERSAIWPEKVVARLAAPPKTVERLEDQLLLLLRDEHRESLISNRLKKLTEAMCAFYFSERRKSAQHSSPQSVYTRQNNLHFTAHGSQLTANLELAELGVFSYTTRQKNWFQQMLGKLVEAYEAHHRLAYPGLCNALVLWVDDNLDSKPLQKARLMLTGCMLIEALSTKEALLTVKKELVHAVITDLGRNGDQSAGFLLAERLARHAPFLPVALYSQSATKFSNWHRNANIVTCTDNFDEVLRTLSNTLKNRKTEQLRDFKSLIEWFDGIDFVNLPMPKRVELMTRLFCCVYRRNLGIARLRSSVLKSVARARIAARQNIYDLPRDDGFTVSHRALIWEHQALFAVASLCEGAALEKPDALSKMPSALEVLDNAPDPTFVTAALAELQAPEWKYHISDSPRAWVALKWENKEFHERLVDGLAIALETFGFGLIGQARWIAEPRPFFMTFAYPWVMDVDSYGGPSNSTDCITCTSIEDAITAISNVADHVVYAPNRPDARRLSEEFNYSTYLEFVLDQFEKLNSEIVEKTKQPAVFVHAGEQSKANSTLWSRARLSLAPQGVHLLNGPMRSAHARYSSLLVELLGDEEAPRALAGEESSRQSDELKAIFLLTESQPRFLAFSKANPKIPIYAITKEPVGNDLAEIARELRDQVENKTYASVSNDSQKHKFANYPTRNRRTLSAKVMQLPILPGWFVVDVEVIAPDHWPLTGVVEFHLDASFAPNDLNGRKRVAQVKNNRAQLTVFAWGAFTVGAVCDEGLTPLELDLSTCLDMAQWRDAERAPEARLDLSELELLKLPNSYFDRWSLSEAQQQQFDGLSVDAKTATLAHMQDLFRRTAKLTAQWEHGVRVRYRVDSRLAVKHASKVRAPVYVFLNHAKEDREAAKSIAQGLESACITVFVMTERHLPDSTMITEINLALAECTHFVALISAQSLDSKFVRTEIATATMRHIRKDLKLVPVLLSEADAKGWRDQFPLLEPVKTLNYQDEKFFYKLLDELQITP